MKTVRKSLILAACAIMLVCATIAGTLAYLTSTDSVKNTFTVGNVSITLDEAPVDEEGHKTASERVQTNTYKLLPGKAYDKDPRVTVKAESEDCYVFVTVTNGISEIESDAEDYTSIAMQMKNYGWAQVPGNTGVYYYNGEKATNGVIAYTASADVTLPVFDNFAIKDGVKGNELKNYNGKTIEVTAYAIQAEGFETVEEAWAEGKPQA